MEYRVRRRTASQRWPRADDGVSDALVRRFLLRAGFRVSSDRAVAHTRQHLAGFVGAVADTMSALAPYHNCMRFNVSHVIAACRVHGIRLYGYDDVCTLENGARFEPYHVTEMVETCTSFGGPEQWEDEPDGEPGARFSKTDFVANYKAFTEKQDDDDDSDYEVSEWSWYGESDAESESGDEAEEDDGEEDEPEDENEDKLCSNDDEDIEMASNSDTKGGVQQGNRFIASLRVAQEMVDAQLLRSPGSDDDEMDEDAPAGQGYFSDVDNSSDFGVSAKQAAAVVAEDQLWETSNNIQSVNEEKAEQALDVLFNEDERDCYVMSRLVFAALFRDSIVGYRMEISTVALSALHNASEQYLHRELTEGVLSYQLKEMIREDEAADLEAQLQEEREKVTAQEQTIADLQAALKAKEIEMQHQISQLQLQLAIQHPDKENVSPNNPAAVGKLKTLGKRKATANSKHVDVVRKEFGKASASTKSTPGSLRAKTHSNTLRAKRTRVNQL